MSRSLVRLFYPAPAPSEEDWSRAELLVFGSVGVVAVSLLMLGLFAAGLAQAPLALASLGCAIITLAALRLSRNLDLASALTSLLQVLACAGAAVNSRDLTLLAWLALVPVASLLYSSIRQSVALLGGATAVIVGVGVWLVQHPDGPRLPPAGALLLRILLGFLLGFGLTLIFAVRRRNTHRSLELARDEADRANKLKSQFLASFSHEVRTPLNGVLGTADALLATSLAPEVREQLLIIQRSGSALLRTINDVLELSRIEAGRVDLFPAPTELPAVLREVVDLFRARAEERGLELELVLEAGHPRHVLVDDLRLRQVLQNLVGNAVKFTRQGFVRVRLSGAPAGPGAVRTRIVVEDSGLGIAPDAQRALFAVFTQARPRLDRTDGTGLGLALSRQFVELMGGTLTLKSEPGKGSTFAVDAVLPLAHVEPPAAALAPAAVRPAGPKLKLLVVDDNEINLKVAEALLRRLGHETIAARDGQQALDAIALHQPDVVLMDCHMPGLDGLEATRQLRARGDLRPVIAITASVYAEDREHSKAAGMNGFVAKPVSLDALQAALNEVCPPKAPGLSVPSPVRRVLVVDDDVQVRHSTVRLLRSAGYLVDEAPDVETARAQLANAVPDCLLVDKVLGGQEDGLNFALRVHGSNPGLRIVVTSGRTPSEQELGAVFAAGGHFLAKPYQRAELIACLGAPARSERPAAQA